MTTYAERKQKALQEIASAVSSRMHGGLGSDALEVWATRCADEDITVDVEQATYTDSDGNEWEVCFTVALADFEMHPADNDQWGFDDDEGDES